MKPLVVVAAAFASVVACSGGSRVAPVDAGADLCASATLRFHFDVVGATTYCAGAPGSCSTTWLSLRRASGEDLIVDRPCAPACFSCDPVACTTLCAMPMRIPEGDVERTWDGRFFVPRECAVDTFCVQPACAEPGRYVATMCAYPDRAAETYCAPEKTPSCADVAFDWPPPDGYGVVVGRVEEAL